MVYFKSDSINLENQLFEFGIKINSESNYLNLELKLIQDRGHEFGHKIVKKRSECVGIIRIKYNIYGRRF